jgi:hypothetical protein
MHPDRSFAYPGPLSPIFLVPACLLLLNLSACLDLKSGSGSFPTIGNDTLSVLNASILKVSSDVPQDTGLTSTCDTARGAVRLAWNPVLMKDLSGYVVYRTEVGDPSSVRSPIATSNDTAIQDVIFSNPNDLRNFGIRDNNDYPVSYTVRAIGPRDEAGPESDPFLVVAHSPTKVRTHIQLLPGPDSIEVGDTLEMRMLYENLHTSNDSIVWSVNGVPRRSIAISSLRGEDVFSMVQLGQRDSRVTVRVRDALGRSWSATRVLSSFIRPPVAFAGNDTVMLKGETLHLQDLGKPGSGKIVSWRWTFPDDSYSRPVSAGDTSVEVTGPRFTRYILTVEDEFGLMSSDTRLVEVAHPGKVWRTVPVTLPGIENRDFKRSCIVFEDKAWMFISSEDESGVKPVQVWNSSDMIHWNRITSNAEFPARIVRSVTTFEKKMWIFGGEKSMDGRNSYNDVWASNDGEHWTRYAESSPLDSGNNGDYAFSQNGRLWLITWNGDIWVSTNGVTWTNRGKGHYRADELHSMAGWRFFTLMFGNKGAFSTFDGIGITEPILSPAVQGWAVAVNISQVLPGFYIVGNDGYKGFTYNIPNGRYLFQQSPFPERWTANLHGLYPHCMVALGGKAWAFQGGRFRDEAGMPIEMMVTY